MPVQTPPPPPTADHQYRPSSTKTGSLTTTTTTTHPPPPESEHLPCPRCDSTNTKFCYYNNYNFSQPRHFCKSCRRYWTHGGTLRDIPVGGGTRKNAKRQRNSSSSTSNTNTTTPTPTSSSSSSAGCVGGSSRSGHPHSKTTLSSSTTGAVTSTVSSGLSLTTGSLIDPVFVSMSSSLPSSGVYVEDYLKPSSSQGQSGVGGNVFPVGSMGSGGSFTSLLNASGGGGFLALGGFGVGPSFEDVGFGRGMWATVPEVSYLDNGANTTASGYGVAGNGGGNFWQMESGGEHHHNNHTNGGSAGVGFVSGDCFSWPELAISTPRNGLK